jgi:hypothetical protein
MKTSSGRTASGDFVAFNVGVDNERERRIVSATSSESLEALCVGPRLVHVGPVRLNDVSRHREVEASRRSPCHAYAGLAAFEKSIPRTWLQEQTARNDEHGVPGDSRAARSHDRCDFAPERATRPGARTRLSPRRGGRHAPQLQYDREHRRSSRRRPRTTRSARPCVEREPPGTLAALARGGRFGEPLADRGAQAGVGGRIAARRRRAHP